MAAACFLAAVTARGQAPAPRPPLAEEVFKNVQVLRGIPVNEFMGTMGIFSAALGMSCEDCHRSGDSSWANYAAESPRKQMARAMVTMMAAINKTHFGGRQAVTCFSCHRGADRPKATPNLATLYGAPPPEDPRDVIEQAPAAPAADAVFDKYLTAVGGAARAAALTSFAATGTSTGYGPDSEPRPFELAAKAPNQRAADRALRRPATAPPCSTAAAAGSPRRTARWRCWRWAAPTSTACASMRSSRFRPGSSRSPASGAPAPPRSSTIARCRRCRAPGAAARWSRCTSTPSPGCWCGRSATLPSPVGRLPTQVDYADYREVAGVKLPFRWTVTWLDGRDTVELKDVRPNVAVDAGRFGRPLLRRDVS